MFQTRDRFLESPPRIDRYIYISSNSCTYEAANTSQVSTFLVEQKQYLGKNEEEQSQMVEILLECTTLFEKIGFW